MKTAEKATAFDIMLEDICHNAPLHSSNPMMGHYTFDLHTLGMNYVRVEIMPRTVETYVKDMEAKITARLVLASRLKTYYSAKK